MSREGFDPKAKKFDVTRPVRVVGGSYNDARSWFQQAYPGISHAFMHYVTHAQQLRGLRGETLHVTSLAYTREDIRHVLEQASLGGLVIKEV